MSNEVVAQKPKFSVVLTEKLNMQRDALPRDFNIVRFVNNSVALLNGNETLSKFAKQYGTAQIEMGLIRGAYLGLDAMNNEMYLVPYGSTINFMPSYIGMKKLCIKYATRPIDTIYADVVKEGDDFDCGIENGKPYLHHHPKPFNDGPIVGAYAVCNYKDGGMMFEQMSLKDLEQCRKSSKAQNSPAWNRFTAEMYKKTVLRRLTKSISIDMDDKLACAMNAGMEIETDPQEIAKRDISENGNTEELVIDVEG